LHDPYHLPHLPRDPQPSLETSAPADAAYMVDQSHNLKRKMEAIIHTVCTAQELYAKAAIVDHGAHGATAAELLAGRG